MNSVIGGKQTHWARPWHWRGFDYSAVFLWSSSFWLFWPCHLLFSLWANSSASLCYFGTLSASIVCGGLLVSWCLFWFLQMGSWGLFAQKIWYWMVELGSIFQHNRYQIATPKTSFLQLFGFCWCPNTTNIFWPESAATAAQCPTW